MSLPTAVVLVLEDDDEIHAALRENAVAPHWVLDASDVRQPSVPDHEAAPDLVIADVRATDAKGLTLYRRICDDPELSAIPVVLLAPKRGSSGGETEASGGSPVLDVDALRALVGHHLAASGTCDEPGSGASLLDAVEIVVERHLGTNDFTVGRLAEAVGLSRRQLTRRMKEERGVTPATFVRRRRLERAERLLAQEPDTIAEVADAVGFHSASAFSKAFREHTGMTPSAYVEQHTA